MRVVVRHGHFAFFPTTGDEVFRFQRLFKKELFAVEDYFTFEALVDLPRWSQVARDFGNLPAVATFEAEHPWQIMRENDFVFSIAAEALVPRATVTGSVTLPTTLNAFLAPSPLVQPGVLLTGGLVPGNVLLGYCGELDLNLQKLYIYAQETLL